MVNQPAVSANFSYLKALEAIKCRKALMLISLTFFTTAIVFGLGVMLSMKLGSTSVMMLFGLLATIVFFIGFSANGYILMNLAKSEQPIKIFSALLLATFSLHRAIASLAILVLTFVLWLGVQSLIFFVCKMPGLGPALFTLVYPLAVLISGVFFIFMFYAVMGVLLPAVWERHTVKEIMTRLWVVCQQKFMSLVLLTLILGFLIMVVTGLIMGVFMTGNLVSGSLSAMVLGSNGSMNSMEIIGNLTNIFSLGSGDGYLTATIIGSTVLYLILMSIPFNVAILGFNLNYLQLIQDLDFTAAKQKLQETIERIEEIKDGAIKDVNSPAETATKKPVEKTASTCSACKAPLTEGDMFCGECGKKQ